MAETKYPIIRYQTLDRCFRNKYKRYYIDDLIDACVKAITAHCGKEIGCSRRTILNDIDFMESNAGWSIPLERHKDGRKVYYRYADADTNFTINESLLSDAELNKLNETISVLKKFNGLPCFEWIDDLLFKLQSGLHKQAGGIIEFEQVPQLRGMQHLDKLFNGILYKQVLEITYRTYREKSYTWNIHPYLIKQYNNRWFLFGKNSSKGEMISNLPLDRINSIADSGTPYEESDGRLEKMLTHVIGVTIDWKKSNIIPIKLRFSSGRFPYILTKPLHHSQHVVDAKDGIVEIAVIPNKELIAALLQFGSDLEVIEPQTLRAQMRKEILEMTKKY